MRKSLVLFLGLASLSTFAGRTVGLGVTAFNAAVPVGTKVNAVFSPYSFEIDSAIISEAFGALNKAMYVEALGALTGYENVYFPMMARYELAVSNNLELVSARGFIESENNLVANAYRLKLQNEYGAETCSIKRSTQGAQRWFRANMDGAMEDFTVKHDVVGRERVGFFDLESLRIAWAEPFPTSNTRELFFNCEDGTKQKLPMMTDIRQVSYLKSSRYSLIRLPMADESFFYAMMPNENRTLDSIREDFSSEKIDMLLTVLASITETGIYHGPAIVAIPKMDITFESDLIKAYQAIKVPLSGATAISSSRAIAPIVERMRFRLDETGPNAKPLVAKPANAQVHTSDKSKNFMLNRPFIFFIYHSPTHTITVAGQFTGKDR